jgi:peptidoglycan/xylan/chitin deacetylase (PgdA/CDA1 family)
MNETIVPFRIVISQAAEGYEVYARVNDAMATAPLALPDHLVELLANARRGGQPQLPPADELGQQLGQALFTPPIHRLLLDAAQGIVDSNARMHIQLQPAAAELAMLPWEWLALGNNSPWRPAIRDDYAMMRVVRGPARSPAPLVGPLRVLVVLARGEHDQYEALERTLATLVEDQIVEIRALRNPSINGLEGELNRETTHVLHIAAPVDLSEHGTPQLSLGRGIDVLSLGQVLREHPDLRLINFTGAHGDGRRLNAGAPALAALLTGDAAQATIAFAGSVPIDDTALFAATCYAAIARGEPIDLAVTEGRSMLAVRNRAWGAAQLRVVAGSEQLFRRSASRPRLPALNVPLPRKARPAAPERDTDRSEVGPRRRAADDMELQRPRRAGRRSETARIPGEHLLPLARYGLPIVAILVMIAFISSLFGGTTSAENRTTTVGAIPTLAPLPTVVPSSPQQVRPANRYIAYLAAEGDTPARLAQRFGSDEMAILGYNSLGISDTLRVGRPLIIPAYREEASSDAVLPVALGNPDQPNVALTFDIEIDDQSVYDILALLKRYDVRGTFFVAGSWVKSYPEAAKAIASAGHEFGNHSMTHPYFSRIGGDGAISELQLTEELVRQTTSQTTRPFFRFPYGDSTTGMLELVAEQGYIAYHWSADERETPGWLERVRAYPRSGNGGILLFHGRSDVVGVLEQAIVQLRELGLNPTTLSETIK